MQHLAESGRRSMLSQLTVVRKMMEWPAPTEEQPFHTLGYVEMNVLSVKDSLKVSHQEPLITC